MPLFNLLPSHADRLRHTARPQSATPLQQVIPAFSNFPQGNLQDGWKEYVHPNGSTYYYKSDLRPCIITEVDPQDAYRMQFIRDAYSVILENLLHQAQWTTFPSMLECYIGIVEQTEGVIQVFHWIANHHQKIVFWAGLLPLPNASISPTVEYWTHVSYFPTHVSLDPAIWHTTVGRLGYWAIDNSGSPFSPQQCHNFMDTLLNGGGIQTGGYHTRALARVVLRIAENDAARQGFLAPREINLSFGEVPVPQRRWELMEEIKAIFLDRAELLYSQALQAWSHVRLPELIRIMTLTLVTALCASSIDCGHWSWLLLFVIVYGVGTLILEGYERITTAIDVALAAMLIARLVEALRSSPDTGTSVSGAPSC